MSRLPRFLTFAILCIAWSVSQADVYAQTNPVIIGVSPEFVLSLASHLDVSSNWVFLSTGKPGFVHWIFDVSNPSAPVPLGAPAPIGNSITTSGSYAFLTDPSAVNIYDVSNPTNAHVVGLITNSGKIVVSGNVAYLACGSNGLEIYDVSTPTTPHVLGHSTNNYGGFAADLAITGNYAYVANGPDGLRVYDVSDPTAPFVVGPSGLSAGAENVTVSGNFAYVGVGQTNYPDYGTTIYDITSRTNPVRGGFLSGFYGGPFGEMNVSGNYLYVVNGPMWIYDVSNFKQPIRAGYSWDGSDWLTDIKVRGSYAYVSAQCLSLYVFSLGTQPSPQLAISRPVDNILQLSWPTPSSAFVVQQSRNLNMGIWQTLTNTPAVVDSKNQILIEAPLETMFYRLMAE